LDKKETNTKLAITTLLLSVLPMSMIGVYIATTQFAYAQTSHTNNMTKYTDPQGRLSINYPSNWTALPTTTNPLQQHVVQFINMAPFANFNIVIAPAALAQTDPATVLNAYSLFPATIPVGYSISQNVECVKYKIVSNRACSIILTSNGKVPSIYIQVGSYVNKKMFIFTMQGTHNDFNNYLPMFRIMLTSFKAPATSLNTITSANKTTTTVNQTTIQKTSNKLTTPITPKTSMCPPYVECSLPFTPHQFQIQQP
jgi:hypothetical protein